MAAPINPKEKERRLKAFEASKKVVQGGSITEACRMLGNVSKSALSRFLLNMNLRTERRPEFTKEECIEGLKAHIKRFGKVTSREHFNVHSQIGTRWKTYWANWQEFLEGAGLIGDSTKILLLDIETAPNRAYFWGPVYKQNINPDWIDAAGYVLCWTAKWLGKDEVIFNRLKNGNHKSLLSPMHKLLCEAHAVIHYNGKKFDIPTLNKEFLKNGLKPPSPYKQVDLLKTMWDSFLFPSNKLDYICKDLKIGEKLRHEGPDMWLDCMRGDEEAWKKMEAYNRRDVDLLEKLYREILPWIKTHPNRAAFSGTQVCPSCGSTNFNRDGSYTANQLKYERYNCAECGVWFRGTKTISPKGRRFALTA